jgi:outer membrane receptor for ferrienterochelin and colicins
MLQDHEHRYGAVIEDDEHESYLLETSIAGYNDNNDWVVGVAHQSEIFSSVSFDEFDYSFEVPGLFAQLDHEHTDQVTSSWSGRVDDHSEYGTQFSPRVSVPYKPGDLTIKGSFGQGYFAPTPFVEGIEAAGLSRLEAIDHLQPEQAPWLI